MLNIEELEKQVEADLTWDMADCDTVCLNIPRLKAKYCSLLYREEISAKNVELQLKAVYAVLHESYLSGIKTNILIDRRDVDIYITGDEKYIAIFAKHELAKQNCKFIDGVLKGIDSMSFAISSAVKWHIFKAGG